MDDDHYAELIPSFLPENFKLLPPHLRKFFKEHPAPGKSGPRPGEIQKYSKREIDQEIFDLLQRDRREGLWYRLNLSAWVREGRFGRSRWLSSLGRLERSGKISVKEVEEPPLCERATSSLIKKKYFKIN